MEINDLDTPSIENTGERLIPEFSARSLVYGEHIVRYEAASLLAEGKDILDIASGTGYGTALLARTAKTVTGVDIDKTAVAYAQKNFAGKNTKFLHGDGTNIPAKDASFDVVVSFETIEHIDDYRAFLAEVKRVLKRDGLFILSTPNDLEYPEGNHFHVHEFAPGELKELVKKTFSSIKSYYQGTWLYSALLSPEQLGAEWDSKIRTQQLSPIDPGKSVYLFLLCSNRAVTEELPAIGAISEHWSERTRMANEAEAHNLRAEHIKTIRRLERTVDKKQEELLKLLQELKYKDGVLKRLYSSKIFRLGQKLMCAKRAIIRRGARKR